MMNRVNTTEDFIVKIYSIQGQSNDDEQIYFRGESKDYGDSKCMPGIFRKLKLIKNEHNLFYDFIAKNPETFQTTKLTIGKLAIMQHYTLPTRLLDITENALMALYFACESGTPKDGVVYVISIPKKNIKHYSSDTVSVLANLSKREKFKFPYKYENTKDKFNEEKSIKFLLHDIKDEKPYFKDEIVPQHLYSVKCLKPLLNTRRIVQQQGAFLIFGNSKENEFKPAILKKSDIKIEPIYIQHNKKEEIIKKLELIGVNKAFVYPDLDKIAEYLQEKYN